MQLLMGRQTGSAQPNQFSNLQAAAWRYYITFISLRTMKTSKQSNQVSIIQQVLTMFHELNQVHAVTKTQVFQLIKLFRHNPVHFQQAWELAYLKIFKIFHQRANRKMPQKYENLASTFFGELLPKDGNPDAATLSFHDYFLEFLAEAVFSSYAGIRIAAARMLFHLLKGSVNSVSEKAKQKILKSVFYLVRLKVSTYKQIGIKLASIVLNWKGTLQKKVQEQFFKIMAVEENEQIRKMAMTNICITPDNLDRVLLRLRDKCTDIRGIILRRLIGEKYPLSDTELSHRLRLLYDGYGNKETAVHQDTLKYFMQFFEHPKYNTFIDFMKMFEPDLLLSQPHLYSLFDRLLIDLLEEMPHSSVEEFMRKLCTELKSCAKGNKMNIPYEIIWLKALAKSENAELKALFEEQIPSGMELAKLLNELISTRDIFSIYECLQLFRLCRSADELGRNKMFESLKIFINNMDNWQTQRANYIDMKDDICAPLTAAAIKQKKLLLSYFDLPPITCSFDLILQAGYAMKSIWPDHYEIELKQLMSDWNNLEENTLLKQKELAQANIRKVVESHSDGQIVASLKGKLRAIEQALQRQTTKTKIMIMTIMRLKPTASMEDYMSIIKQELSNKEDQSEGLILLGLYCLEDRERAENFLPLFWAHINKEEQDKLHLLVSLRVLTDLFIKFDFRSLETTEVSQIKPQQFGYNAFIKKMLQCVINQDGDIRMVSIEGLCRLIYHNRVNEQKLMSCFMRLLLLWWETSSEQISARSVHTISIFIKQYLEKGQSEVRKLAEFLCIFFKMIIICEQKSLSINKKKIVYNLKMEEFVRRSVVIAMTVMKYHKESRQITWKYQQDGAQLGPQELLLLFLFKEEKMHFCLEKAINICDFYEEAPLQTLILVKKQVQTFMEQNSIQVGKKLETVLKKLESDLEDRIQIKNRETFNQSLLTGLKDELQEYNLLIETSGVAVTEQLSKDQILVENKHVEDESEEDELSELMEELQPEDLEGLEEEFLMNEAKKQNSVQVANKQSQVSKKQLNRISQKVEEEPDSEAKDIEKRGGKKETKKVSAVIKQKKIEHIEAVPKKKEERRANRKRMPSPMEQQPSGQGDSQRIISGRTRSKVLL